MPRDLASSGVQSSRRASPAAGSTTAARALSASPAAEFVGSCGKGLCKFKLPSPEWPPAALFSRQIIDGNNTEDREADGFDLHWTAQRSAQKFNNQREQQAEHQTRSSPGAHQQRPIGPVRRIGQGGRLNQRQPFGALLAGHARASFGFHEIAGDVLILLTKRVGIALKL